MGQLVSSLQGKLAEVYFVFKEIKEIIHIYEETLVNAAKIFQNFNWCMPRLLF